MDGRAICSLAAVKRRPKRSEKRPTPALKRDLGLEQLKRTTELVLFHFDAIRSKGGVQRRSPTAMATLLRPNWRRKLEECGTTMALICVNCSTRGCSDAIKPFAH